MQGNSHDPPANQFQLVRFRHFQQAMEDIKDLSPNPKRKKRKSRTHRGDKGAPDVSPPAVQFSPQNTVLQGAQSVTISGHASFKNVGRDNVTNTTNVTHIYDGTHGLEKMEAFVSFSAQSDSSAQDPERRCHPSTREYVLMRIRHWIDNPNAHERIFWLYGPAGAGKSAIAQTIARSYDQPKVAATFFFFRSDITRNDGNRLFTTLSYQLAFSTPDIRNIIAQVLRKRPDLPTKDVETQFDQLIARPFWDLDIKSALRRLAPVVIIDGVDECTEEKLQQRFLKVIGDAVKDDRLPLRFLICCRPEAHIEETISRFQRPILSIDLSKLSDADRDIEKYLVDHFSRIASEQGLEPTWPGQEIIQDIVYKSSGNFIFPSVVIRFVGDPDNVAETQLDIIRNLRHGMMTPFAMLDELFLEILRRVPDQVFLKRFLALLVARISAPSEFGDLYKDDAVLMHVSEKALHIKLRRLRSLLKFDPYIDVHHRSFLDFLHDSSRAGQYYTGESDGTTRWFELFIDSLVRYVSMVMEQPNYHNTFHFNPEFGNIIRLYPQNICQSAKKWKELIQALVHLQDELLKLPNFVSTWKFLPCDECSVFNIMNNLLLHLPFHRETPSAASIDVVESVTNKSEAKCGRVVPLVPGETDQSIFNNDVDSFLSSLLTNLQTTEVPGDVESPSTVAISHIYSILRFHYDKTAMMVRSTSDAQRLVEILVYLIDEKNILRQCDPDATRRAAQLALQIFARIPVLSRSLCLRGNYRPEQIAESYPVVGIQLPCQTAFVCNVLGCDYVAPLLGIQEQARCFRLIYGKGNDHEGLIMEWKQRSKPSSITIIQVMLKVARVISHLHSIGVLLDYTLSPRNVLLGSELRPKFRCIFSISQDILDKNGECWFSREENIFSFGCLFYEVYFNIDTYSSWGSIASIRRIVVKRPPEPDIPAHVWQLIQWCCTEDPKKRPTIDEVVQEMETWKCAQP